MGTNVTVSSPAKGTASAATLAPAKLYVGVDIDQIPFNPSASQSRGWRIALGPPVTVTIPVATASTAGVAPSPAVSVASLKVPVTTATATALDASPLTTYQTFPSQSDADALSVGPKLTLKSLPDLAGADSAGLKPTLYVGEDLFPVFVEGAAQVSAQAVAPALSISYEMTTDVASATSDTVAPTPLAYFGFPYVLPFPLG